jgi:hypothetical protein
MVLGVLWALLAPEERSLGAGIRPVYLHVSATWAGVTLLYLVGVWGGVAALLPRVGRVSVWLRAGWTAGLTAFAAGFALSLVAARVSWGGVFWAEPRVLASIAVVALGLVALAVEPGDRPRRWGPSLWAVAALACYGVLRNADTFVHPERPIRPTTPWSIRGTFFGLYALFLVSASAFAVMLAGRRQPTPPGDA